MREKETKSFMQKIKDKIKKSDTFVKFLRVRDKLAERILAALLAFFDAISPCWKFLFLKTPEEIENESSQRVIQFVRKCMTSTRDKL